MNIRMLTVSYCVISLVCIGLVHGDDADSWALDVTADLYSKYIWRGQNLNDGAVFQPSVSLAVHGFTSTIWGSLDLTNENDHRGELTEVDFSLDYSAVIPNLEAAEVSVGAVHYRYPNTVLLSTSEVYAGVSVVCFLNPSARVYYDVDEINGAYLQLAVAHTIEKVATFRENCHCGCVLGLSIGYGSAGYNEGSFGVDENAFNDLTTSLSLPVSIKGLTINPSVNYSRMLADDIRTATASSENLWAGISATYAF